MKWIDPTLVNAPPGWETVDTLLSHHMSLSRLGFVGSAGDLNRFCSRYRLAKSFRGVALDNYVSDTVDGYSALFRVFLTWSCFEQFMRVCGLTLNKFVPLITGYNPGTLESAIRSVPDYEKFLAAVLAELDRGPHAVNLTAFLYSKPCNVLVVPAAIRHIFAHGKLTPNSGAGHVQAACAISGLVSDFLFRTIDGEFVRRLRSHGIKV